MNKVFSILVLCVFCLISDMYGQNSVYIEANEFGRGLLIPREGECFVIAPLHVVDNTNKPINIIGDKNVLSTGELAQSFTYDLAAIRIKNGGKQVCGKWEIDDDYSTLLSGANEGYLEIRQNDGSTKLMQVFISEKDDETITIEPKKNNQSFKKGMSGSSLFMDYNGEKNCLGMLLEIDSENQNGIVIQLDDMNKTLESYFPPIYEENRNIVDDFQFDFLGVENKDGVLFLNFKVTNLDEKDRNLSLKTRNAVFWTDKGNKYNGHKFCITNNCTNLDYKGRVRSNPKELMPSSLPLNVTLEVRGDFSEENYFLRGDIFFNEKSSFRLNNIKLK